MGLKWALLPILVLYWFSIVSPVSAYRVVCYYGSWAVYRPGEGKFDVEDIDPFICTHIIFGFVGLNNDGTVRVLDSWNEVDKAAFERFSCLKKVNPSLKTLIAIGGWNEGSTKYSEVARDANKRATFIRSAVNIVETYGYDGFDLDWEYPNQRGGIPADVQNFVQLLKEFKEAFKPKGLLLTAAVAACQSSASLSYNIPEVCNLLDFVNVMTYDMHGCWDNVTGHNAPLRGSPDGLDIETCISYWFEQCKPPEKINLGIGLYGRGFALSNTNNRDIGVATSGCGQAGPFTRENGILGYNEICKNNWPRIWNDVQKVPIAIQGNQWFGYDDPESIGYKIEFLKSKGLGGAMTWSLETDDFLGVCGKGRNPLLNAIRTGLGLSPSTSTGWGSPCANRTITWWSPPVDGGGGSDPWTDPNPGNGGGNEGGSGNEGGGDGGGSGNEGGGDGGGSGGTNPSNPPSDGICSKAEYVRDPSDCAVFYYCQPNGAKWIISTFNCPAGTVYNTNGGYCDWPNNVQC